MNQNDWFAQVAIQSGGQSCYFSREKSVSFQLYFLHYTSISATLLRGIDKAEVKLLPRHLSVFELLATRLSETNREVVKLDHNGV